MADEPDRVALFKSIADQYSRAQKVRERAPPGPYRDTMPTMDTRRRGKRKGRRPKR